jgi:hypothetical protein
MSMHTCAEPGCGLVHDFPGGSVPPNPEVEIARINADRDVSVARLQARQDADWNETRVEVAGIEAGALVAEAEVTAEVIGAAIEAGAEASVEGDEAGEPVIVVADPGAEEPAAPPPPELEGDNSGPKKSKGIWPI